MISLVIHSFRGFLVIVPVLCSFTERSNLSFDYFSPKLWGIFLWVLFVCLFYYRQRNETKIEAFGMIYQTRSMAARTTQRLGRKALIQPPTETLSQYPTESIGVIDLTASGQGMRQRHNLGLVPFP